SESFNARRFSVRESIGREVVGPVSTLFCLACVDGFAFLAMFWSPSLSSRPSPHMPREPIRPLRSSSRFRIVGSSMHLLEHMAVVVPESNDRFVAGVFVTQDAERRRAQDKQPAIGGR